MSQTRSHLGALVGLAFSIACSSNSEGPVLEGAGNGPTAGSTGASGAPSVNGGSTASGGRGFGGEGGASDGGSSAVGSNGGVSGAGASNAGTNTGGASTGGKGGGGNAGTTGGASSGAGAGSSGHSSGGSSSGGVGSGGKGSGGSSAGSGGKSSGGAGGVSNGGTSSGGTGGNSACPEVTAQLCGMTAQHNQARANVDPVPTTPLPSMAWDATVAAAAQTWADQCNFSHNTAGYGQNLYASAGSGPPTPATVVTSWASEVSSYNYSANTCSGTCGHYTQVVWRNSTLLGCGVKACSTNTPFGSQFPNWYIVVCNYSPAGNNGSRPY